MRRSFWAVVPALVLAGAVLGGCQHAGESRDAGAATQGKPVVKWTSLLCTPAMNGVDVSVQDVAMGTRVVFESSLKDADALRAAVADHARPVTGRIPTDPVVAMNVLPANTTVTVQNIPGGAAVTYQGTTTEEQTTIRKVVGPAARELAKGECTMLQAIAWLPAAEDAKQNVDQRKPRRDPSERVERFLR